MHFKTPRRSGGLYCQCRGAGNPRSEWSEVGLSEGPRGRLCPRLSSSIIGVHLVPVPPHCLPSVRTVSKFPSTPFVLWCMDQTLDSGMLEHALPLSYTPATKGVCAWVCGPRDGTQCCAHGRKALCHGAVPSAQSFFLLSLSE